MYPGPYKVTRIQQDLEEKPVTFSDGMAFFPHTASVHAHVSVLSKSIACP